VESTELQVLNTVQRETSQTSIPILSHHAIAQAARSAFPIVHL